MKYFHAIKGGVIAFIFFSFAAFLIPGYGPSNDIEIILTVSTFLFAILVGFYISRLSSRYNKIREFIAIEDAYWIAFFQSTTLYDKKLTNKVKNLIDKYYIEVFDREIIDSYKPTSKYFMQIYNEMAKLKKYRNESFFQGMFNCLSIIEENRNKASVLGLEKIAKSQWVIIYLLASIIIFCLFYLKIPAFYSYIITILLSTVLILVILLLRDLQNLRLGGEIPVTESGQEVLESIGKMRYYNKKYFKEAKDRIPESVTRYRLGKHKPGEKHNITIIYNK